MHSAGCVYGCVYAAGRKQGRLKMIFLPLPVYLKNAEWVPGAAVLEITWPSFLRLGAWGRRAALPGEGWLVNGKYAGVSAPGARCGQHCPPSPTPALGLPSWAPPHEAAWGLQCALPAHPCGNTHRREVRGDRRWRELLFPSLGHPLPFFATERDGI